MLTGVGAVSPAGPESKAHLSGLLAGRSAARELTEDWFAPFAKSIGAPVDSVTPAAGLPRHVAYADLAITEALAEAGLDAEELAGTHLVTSTAIGASVELETAFRDASVIPPGWFGFDLVTERAREQHKVGRHGWSMTLSTGCTAGLDALGTGYDAVAAGRARRVLVVSAEATMCPIVLAAFQKIGALSNRDVEAERASAPFSRQRDGFVLGEGAAAVLLEDAELATARGAQPLLEVLGWASVSSAYHMTRIRRSGEDIAASIRQALDDAGLPPDAVESIDAHGTSTPLNDASETAAYHDVFGARANRLPVVAQKGVTGHALGASNLLEIAGLARYLPGGALPPTANTTAETLDADLDVVLDEPRLAEPEIVVKTSSGFSGIHSAAVLRRIS
ncbi:beta-ketoacyl-[acyl-carrier-protein] synthase family protein [Herbihabitans rhizosphaerae]|uniref:beta-ketoacyl-[acyl-carrier-protein] synthase family protein n=1 Tax=Herbihabitans rhizosphaerae TaxID=1872711 RepID=UPI0013EE539E|nr:beta-ketoacyl-[acyl-carrier-protein] synthase family protein [Herbihabitans rhizosphaerae]